MPPDLSRHPLIAWAQRPEINQVSRFVAVCEQLTHDVLVAAYQAERAAAPQRALAGKRYLTTARQGFPHTTGVSNRGEEHLALAIFNAYGGKAIATPHGELLRVIDYQVPLKQGLAPLRFLRISNGIRNRGSNRAERAGNGHWADVPFSLCIRTQWREALSRHIGATPAWAKSICWH